MNTTTNILVLTAITVVAGRWSQGKSFDFKALAGTVVVIVFLYIASTFVPDVAVPLAALTLVASLLTYGPSILKHLGA